MPRAKKLPPSRKVARGDFGEEKKQQLVCRLVRENGPNFSEWGAYGELLEEVGLVAGDVTKEMLAVAVKEVRELDRAELVWPVQPLLLREGSCLAEAWRSRDGSMEVRCTFEPSEPAWCVAVRLEKGSMSVVGEPTPSLGRAFEMAEEDWRERFGRPLAISNKELVLDEHEALSLVVEKEEDKGKNTSDNKGEEKKKRLAPAGVVDFLIQELQKASKEAPVPRKELLRRMQEKFSPERSKKQLDKTLSSQLSRHLRGRKGLLLVQTEEGWYINEQRVD